MKTDKQVGEMDEMEVVIRSHGDFAYGSEKVEDVAQIWRDYDFRADEVDAWLKAGCFDAHGARSLADNGFSPDEVTPDTMIGTGNYKASIGYKYANGDLDIDGVKKILRPTKTIGIRFFDKMGEVLKEIDTGDDYYDAEEIKAWEDTLNTDADNWLDEPEGWDQYEIYPIEAQ
jgi:hypothetical protein